MESVPVHDEYASKASAQDDSNYPHSRQERHRERCCLQECTQQLTNLQHQLCVANAVWREYHQTTEEDDCPDLAADELAERAMAELQSYRLASLSCIRREQLTRALWKWWKVMAQRAFTQNRLMQMEREWSFSPQRPVI